MFSRLLLVKKKKIPWGCRKKLQEGPLSYVGCAVLE